MEGKCLAKLHFITERTRYVYEQVLSSFFFFFFFSYFHEMIRNYDTLRNRRKNIFEKY